MVLREERLGRQQQRDGNQYSAHPQWFEHDGADVWLDAAHFRQRIFHSGDGGDFGLHYFLPFPRVHACSRLIVNNSKKDTTSITTAMAVAPA